MIILAPASFIVEALRDGGGATRGSARRMRESTSVQAGAFAPSPGYKEATKRRGEGARWGVRDT